MDDPRWSVQDAKNRFSEVVEAARARPQTVTKHGKRAVVVVAADEYDRLKKLDRQKPLSFKEHLLNMPRDDGKFERMNVTFRKIRF
jgi:prevent-host-death family protein